MMRIEQLQFSYTADTPVLEDVTAALRPGAVTALIGPNAAGKSTLLRCMIGQLSPDRGAVRLDSEPVHRIPPRMLARRVAYVAQRSAVAALFTVRQVVELGRYALPPRAKRIDDALAAMDVADLADRPFAALSVGQQQRVMLARALAQLPPDGCLVLDEPTSALDLSHVASVTTMLADLARDGASIIWAVHDIALAARAADDVWLMEQGRLAAAGPVCDVMTVSELNRVFGVGFEWIDRPGRTPVLLAEM